MGLIKSKDMKTLTTDKSKIETKHIKIIEFLNPLTSEYNCFKGMYVAILHPGSDKAV